MAGCFMTRCCCCSGNNAGTAITPNIGENGNWWIGDEDTGVKAQGHDGTTPHIGENGNWFLGETDTGVKAQGPGEEVYSTKATRIGTWIDGKPIYRRVFQYNGTVPAATTATPVIALTAVPPNILGDIDQMIDLKGHAYCEAGYTIVIPNFQFSAVYDAINGIRLQTQMGRIVSRVVIVAEYTV